MRTQWLVQALLAAALAACQATGPPQPVKSPIDDREYRHVVLPNHLHALLIHAPGSDRAAAAASVARGSDHDPDAHEGLAHFVEHMLFIATEKYPEVDGFTDFVLKHGGSYSAYTASDRTTYHFHLKADRLPEALDRFAQFFVAPRFDPDYVEREKESVQSEYQLQSKQDEWRGFAVDKQLFNPAHPTSRFNIGSLETLRGAGVPEVRAFFEANYSADAITVAVLGPQDLDHLEALVAERFGAVVDRGLGARPSNPPLYSPGTLPASYAWRTVKDTRSVGFTFPIPPLKPHYRTKPANHLAGLVGHEGPGSLHDVLSRRGWIEALYAWDNVMDEQNATFEISMTLTDAGAPHVAEIVDLTYAWIDLIRREAIAAWRYREDARIADLGFRFQDQTTPTAAVIAAAEALADYPPEDVLRHSYLMERFDEPLIRRFLGFLTPENALVSISGLDIDGDRIEPIFGTAWRTGPAMLPRHVDARLELPEPNPYVPEDLNLALEPEPPGIPVLLATGTAVETWHAPDTEFRTPTARVDLQLRAAQPLTPDDVVLAVLHAELVKDSMNARAYAAGQAGLAHYVSPTWTGLRIYVSGFHDNLAVLFEDALDAFVDRVLDVERFAVARTELAKGYANQKLRRPHEQVVDTVYRLLHPRMWPVDALLDAAQRATPATLSAWRRTRLASMGATLLVHGNLLEDDARSLAALAQRRLGIVDLPHVLPKARRLTGSRRYEHAVEHDDAAYALYIQGSGDADQGARAHRSDRPDDRRPLLHGAAHRAAARLHRSRLRTAHRATPRDRLRRAGVKGRRGRGRGPHAGIPRRAADVVPRALRRRTRGAQERLRRGPHAGRPQQLRSGVASSVGSRRPRTYFRRTGTACGCDCTAHAGRGRRRIRRVDRSRPRQPVDRVQPGDRWNRPPRWRAGIVYRGVQGIHIPNAGYHAVEPRPMISVEARLQASCSRAGVRRTRPTAPAQTLHGANLRSPRPQ